MKRAVETARCNRVEFMNKANKNESIDKPLDQQDGIQPSIMYSSIYYMHKFKNHMIFFNFYIYRRIQIKLHYCTTYLNDLQDYIFPFGLYNHFDLLLNNNKNFQKYYLFNNNTITNI